MDEEINNLHLEIIHEYPKDIDIDATTIHNFFILYFAIFKNYTENKIKSIPSNLDEFIKYIEDNVEQTFDIKNETYIKFIKTFKKNALIILNKIKNTEPKLETFGTIDFKNTIITYSDEEKKRIGDYNIYSPKKTQLVAGGKTRRFCQKKRKTKTKKIVGGSRRRRRQTKKYKKKNK